ncbi:phosphate acyltransferase PlsX [Piscirickettsia salmonis]|uniref:phosphate acyltransferase PlsX n=1 Tax=Piscirickettsia salmonis TaxID=1238 RepID=UPI0007D76400|nr:Phosphate acyltransferase [Piscirickettsiaceae bacterium NZ-RLO1]
MITIALDAMGGDFGCEVVVPAAFEALSRCDDIRIILVGERQAIEVELARAGSSSASDRLSVHHASEVVEMDESPALALRGKKDSSMRVSINLVKSGQAHACVSAGNTGALMATARFVLKMIPGLDRPAIVYALPTMNFSDPQSILNERVYMLDLGANVDCTADHLHEFAVMGSVLVSAVRGIKHPRIALLNNGSEEIKGNEQVKAAAQILSNNNMLNYIGYVEGDGIYKAQADVIVCDGFVGNVALKVTEGVAKLISILIKDSFSSSTFRKLCAVTAMPALNDLKHQLDMSRYNGASFLGLKGTVVKSHGSASISAFATAIEEARLEAIENVPDRIQQQVQTLLEKQEG